MSKAYVVSLTCLLYVGAVLGTSHVDAKQDKLHFSVGISVFESINSKSVSKALTDEFSDHTVFLGRSCSRFCSDGQSSEPSGTTALSIGAGYAFNRNLEAEISMVWGPVVRSTVAQSGNPLWYLTNNEVTSLKASVIAVRPLSENFELRGKAAVHFDTVRVTYDSYVGNGGIDNLQGSGSYSNRSMNTSLSGGLWLVRSKAISVGVDLTFLFGSTTSFSQSVDMQVRFKPFGRN